MKVVLSFFQLIKIRMKQVSIAVIICMAFLCTSFSALFAQSEQEQRIQSSYILAFNRKASTGEVNYWITQGNLNMSQLLARHKDYIKSNPNIWDGIMNVSYTDAFGRPITDGEKKFHKPYPRTYFEMMNGHMDYLTKNASLYEGVIIESYKRAFGRKPSTDELNYWKGQTKCSFIWLFRAHTQFAATQRRSNVASLSGVTFVRVTPGLLKEVRSAAASMVAAGGGNLIGNDGSTMVAAGGGNLIGNDSAGLVAAGGGN
jgi:hypothetical protein